MYHMHQISHFTHASFILSLPILIDKFISNSCFKMGSNYESSEIVVYDISAIFFGKDISVFDR